MNRLHPRGCLAYSIAAFALDVQFGRSVRAPPFLRGSVLANSTSPTPTAETPDGSAVPGEIRENGVWAEDKLNFLDRYAPPALTATLPKPNRHYIDLFAGPGRWREKGASEAKDGAVLRMIAAEGRGAKRPCFTHGTFINLDPGHHASLRSLVEERCRTGACRIPTANLTFINADANAVLQDVFSPLSRHDYVLAVVDFESPRQWPWTSTEALHQWAPRSTDLYLMMPTQMALVRMMARDHTKVDLFSGALDAFFGCRDWKKLVLAARNDRERAALPRQLEDLYCDRLKDLGWKHSIVVRTVRRTGRQALYSMILATSSDVAKKLADWETRTKLRPQLDFLD